MNVSNFIVPMATVHFVWKEGRAQWVDELEYKVKGWPPVLCEICGVKPALGVYFESIERTKPWDKVHGYLPGRPHHFCDEHAPHIHRLSSDPTEAEWMEFIAAREKAEAWVKSLRMVAP